VTAANGTVTLEAALLAAGIRAGDEVIVPPISFIATATAVLRIGAVPVFADIDESTYNLDPARLNEAVTERTRAIIPVHFAGQPADMDAIIEIAEQHDLVVIEDCAHAHGATWRGKRVGSFGTFGSFSFQASKNMTAGEGGILTTSDNTLAERARSVCNQGRRTGGGWFEHVRLGTNYRLTGWQAAVLLQQLERLPQQLETRADNARFLTEQLAQLDIVTTPYVDERVTCHSYYLYPLRLNRERFPDLTKEKFVRALVAEGIPCADGYPHPLYAQHVFALYEHRRGDCPAAERMCDEVWWVSHEVMLAQPEDLGDFAAAVAKVSEGVAELARNAAV
jgi:dTDP-4-amino-4,6-dideoxygalactose transaminase